MPKSVPLVSLQSADNTVFCLSADGRAFVIGGFYSIPRVVDALLGTPVYCAAIRAAEEKNPMQPARVCCIGQRPPPHQRLGDECFVEEGDGEILKVEEKPKEEAVISSATQQVGEREREEREERRERSERAHTPHRLLLKHQWANHLWHLQSLQPKLRFFEQ